MPNFILCNHQKKPILSMFVTDIVIFCNCIAKMNYWPNKYSVPALVGVCLFTTRNGLSAADGTSDPLRLSWLSDFIMCFSAHKGPHLLPLKQILVFHSGDREKTGGIKTGFRLRGMVGAVDKPESVSTIKASVFEESWVQIFPLPMKLVGRTCARHYYQCSL